MYRVIASFTDTEKFRFIESVWKPDLLFEFPASKETCGKQRKFRQEWLVKYPWLVYSKYLDGAFCLPCVCFGVECGKNGAKLDKLFRSPLTFWTTARGKFDSHASGKSEIHKFSVMAMQNFLAAMRRQTCERSISCLRYLKNYLRGTMGEERLNGLAIMHAHRDIPLDLDEIIDLFASLHPRRMRMANILCSDD